MKYQKYVPKKPGTPSSQNIVKGNGINVTGHQRDVIIRDVIINEPIQPDVAEYKRTNAIPLGNITVKGTKIFSVIVGIISLLSSIITITEFGFKNNNLFDALPAIFYGLMFLFIFLLCVIYLIRGFRENFKRIGYEGMGINFEVSEEDQIYLTKIKGSCPCGGILKLKSLPSGQCIGVCNKNRDHIFSFDHTTFTGYRLEKINFYLSNSSQPWS